MAESFLEDCYLPGKQLARDAIDELPDAISAGQTAALAKWRTLNEVFEEHEEFIANTAKYARRNIRLLLEKVASMVMMAQIAIPVTGIVLIICYACCMWVLFDTEDTTTKRIRSVEGNHTRHSLRSGNLRKKLSDNAPVYMWPAVHWATYILLPLLGVMAVTLPLRYLDPIVNIAHLVNQANRRHVLSISAIQLAREASYGDRLSGHDSLTLGALAYHAAEETLKLDTIIRTGGDFDIKIGTDHNFPAVDAIMYSRGDNLPLAENHTFFPLVSGGLHHALMTTLRACADLGQSISEADLPREGPIGYEDGHLHNLASVPQHVHIWALPEQYRETLHVFVDHIQEYLSRESDSLNLELETNFLDLFSQVHVEMRLLYGVNMAFVVCIFFLGVFKQTTAMLVAEVLRTRRFVRYIPMTLLADEHVAAIRSSFADEDE